MPAVAHPPDQPAPPASPAAGRPQASTARTSASPPWTAPAARRPAPQRRSPGAGCPQAPGPPAPAAPGQVSREPETPPGPGLRQAAHHRPAQTIPGIGQPVLHSGHLSPPEADPWPARAPPHGNVHHRCGVTLAASLASARCPPSHAAALSSRARRRIWPAANRAPRWPAGTTRSAPTRPAIGILAATHLPLCRQNSRSEPARQFSRAAGLSRACHPGALAAVRLPAGNARPPRALREDRVPRAHRSVSALALTWWSVRIIMTTTSSGRRATPLQDRWEAI